MIQNKEIIRKMRFWLKYDEWSMFKFPIEQMDDNLIFFCVAVSYKGGLKAFIRDTYVNENACALFPSIAK